MSAGEAGDVPLSVETAPNERGSRGPIAPVQTLRVAKAAARRALMHRGLAYVGRGLLAGAVVGAVTVFLLRGLGKLPARGHSWAWDSADGPWALVAALPVAVGGLLGIGWALATRWTIS